jgi:hypothetical protein
MNYRQSNPFFLVFFTCNFLYIIYYNLLWRWILKKMFTFTAILAAFAFSQDQIIRCDGTITQGIVSDITPSYVAFRLNDEDNIRRSILRSDILTINFANGTQEIFGCEHNAPPAAVHTITVIDSRANRNTVVDSNGFLRFSDNGQLVFGRVGIRHIMTPANSVLTISEAEIKLKNARIRRNTHWLIPPFIPTGIFGGNVYRRAQENHRRAVLAVEME